VSFAIVVAGKAAASYLSARLAGFDSTEVRLVFGLTIAQAAATLAAVTIGRRWASSTRTCRARHWSSSS
jgi:hypothetical protein